MNVAEGPFTLLSRMFFVIATRFDRLPPGVTRAPAEYTPSVAITQPPATVCASTASWSVCAAFAQPSNGKAGAGEFVHTYMAEA